MKRILHIPTNYTPEALIYSVLSMLGYEAEITYDFRTQDYIITVEERYYGKINTVRDFD